MSFKNYKYPLLSVVTGSCFIKELALNKQRFEQWAEKQKHKRDGKDGIERKTRVKTQ